MPLLDARTRSSCAAAYLAALLLLWAAPGIISRASPPPVTPPFAGGNCGRPVCTWLPFGPQSYVRNTGKPVTVSNTFSILNPNTQYTLHVENSGISSAVISLNGTQVLGPSDFDPNVNTIDKAVSLQLNNEVDVQLRSGPGNSLTVSIIGVDNDLPTITVSAAPVADTFGWNNTNVVVTFTCSDKTSGVASCPAAVTVSTEGANQVISGTTTDRAGNFASTSVTINLDKTPPTITASAAPPANSFGWNNAAVTVTFNCQDALSGIATCTAPATLNAEGANQIAAGTAVDKAGNIASTSVTINIDRTPPTISAQAIPAANAAGWNNTNVNVVFTCADSLSGVASCPPADAVSSEGANQNISGTAFDKAGNTASTTVVLNVDKTPPVITASLVPAANSFGWNNSTVTVNFACSDALSGVASCASPVTFAQEGSGQTANGTATDVAGNTSSASATVNIDETPPTLTASAAPPPNQNGWNNSGVTVTFACADALSGVASCPAPQTVTTEGANQTVSGAASDKAGNTASAKAILNVDETPPVIAAIVSPSPNSAGWNNTTVTVNFNCSDALSGVDFCPTQVVASTEGAKQAVSGTARDRAGNTATASARLNIDKTPPVLAITSPKNGALVIVPTVTIEGTVTDALSGVAGVTCNGVAAQVSGAALTCGVPLSAGPNTVSVVATDVAGNTTTSSLTVSFSATPTITITSPMNLSVTNTTPVTVTGTVSDPNAAVTVNGISAPLSSGTFSVPVPLKEGGNTITVVAQSAGGTPGTATISISLDTTPPHVTIDSPPDGTVTTASTIAVSGLINDIVPGTVNIQQASVTVNGIAAQVLNRNYLLRAVPLSPGPNTITAVGTDVAGNSASVSITVVQKAAISQPTISLVSGDGQSATIGTALAAPLVVQLKDGKGNPVSGQPVVFKVTGSNGTLSGNNPVAGVNGGPTLVVNSDSSGLAQVTWTLGMRAGAGNNTVSATATNFIGQVNFGAISLPATPGLISLDSGNNQTGATGQPLPHPFVVVVTDAGHNRLPNIRVNFTVKQGGGFFFNQGIQINPIPAQTNFTTITVKTDSDGRAMAILTLGQQEGIHNNLVEADFVGNQGFPATFTASGRVAGDPAATSISGVALDNTNIPIAGITLQVDGTPLTTQSDQQGQFLLTGVPVGRVKLIADGATAARPGTWPKLEYELVTVSGTNNTLGMPVYLLPLDLPHGLQVDQTHGGTLTLPDVPGFALTIAPGSVTFPDGGKSGLVSVTVVHADKVPMTPNFGQQPRFIISIQPAGAHFNPPAPMTIPNVDGLSPGEVTEMYSFDHDLGSFVAIGTATVSKDGSVIKSDPGVGIVKGGWHCGGNPTTSGTTHNCGTCETCIVNTCVPSPTGTNCGPCWSGGSCTGGSTCTGGTPLPYGTSCGSCFSSGGFCDGNGNCVAGPSNPNGTSCNQNPCIGGQTCQNGSCQGGTPLASGTSCSVNNNSCQPGVCDGAGTCVPGSITVGAPCSNLCVTGGTCNSSGVCTGGTAVACNSGNVCSPQMCDPTNGACIPGSTPPLNAGCDLCTVGATCDATGTCSGGTPTAAGTSCGGCFTFGATCDGHGSCVGGSPAPNGSACGVCFTGGSCQNGVCLGGVPVSFQVQITTPSSSTYFPFLVRRKFGDVATLDAITPQATVTPSEPLDTLIWTITGDQVSGSATPPNGTGPSFTFVPNPPAHPPYVRGNNGCSKCDEIGDVGHGNCDQSDPFSYTIAASFCSDNASTTITQDELDVIIQEYLNHGLDADRPPLPGRTDFRVPTKTDHFSVDQVNPTCYDVILGDPGLLAEKVRTQYNILVNSDIQNVPVGTQTGNPAARIVVPGGTPTRTIGAIIHTPACNLSPKPVCTAPGQQNCCDDQVVVNNNGDPIAILAGPDGIADTAVFQQDVDIKLNSTWRNPQRNEAVGGVQLSRHQFGNAVDLAPLLNVGHLNRGELMCVLLTAGQNVATAFAEDNPANPVPCNATGVTHIHVQQ